MTTKTITWEQSVKRAVRSGNRYPDKLGAALYYLRLNGFGDSVFGIESIELCGRKLTYLNAGDTYGLTVCCENDRCFVSSWGDWVEQVEREYCDENNVIRCGYCGKFTVLYGNWCETVCSYCERNVSTGELA